MPSVIAQRNESRRKKTFEGGKKKGGGGGFFFPGGPPPGAGGYNATSGRRASAQVTCANPENANNVLMAMDRPATRAGWLGQHCWPSNRRLTTLALAPFDLWPWPVIHRHCLPGLATSGARRQAALRGWCWVWACIRQGVFLGLTSAFTCTDSFLLCWRLADRLFVWRLALIIALTGLLWAGWCDLSCGWCPAIGLPACGVAKEIFAAGCS